MASELPMVEERTGHRFRLTCWGEFALSDRVTDAPVRGRKARALLAYLALHPGKSVSRERIATLLWGDRGDEQARASLRQTLFELKPFVEGGLLQAGRESLGLDAAMLTTDIDDLGVAAEREDAAAVAKLLPDADERLFANLDDIDEGFDDWLSAERVAQAGRLEALVARVAAAADEYGDDLRRWLMRRGVAVPSLPMATPAAVAQPAGAVATVPSRPEWRRWIVVGLVAVAILIALGLVLRPRAEKPPSSISIAVLPLEAVSPRQKPLAEGLWDDTRAALSRNPTLRVIGRTTTKALAGQSLTPAQWRDRVAADYILDGSIREDANRLRVSVELVRTSDGASVWEHAFNAPAAQPLALQQVIANGIEGRLRARLALGGGVKAGQIGTSPEVLALYNKARALIRPRDWQQTQDAILLLRRAVAADPNFAPAWSRLGVALMITRYGPSEGDRRRAEARASIRRALALAPNLAEAYAALALVEGEGAPSTIPALRKALSLDPSNAESWNWLGNALIGEERVSEAIAAYRQATALDPLWLSPASNLVGIYSEENDGAALEGVIAQVRHAGADRAIVQTLRSRAAMARGDYSGGVLPLLALRRDPRLTVSTSLIGEGFIAMGMGEVAAQLWRYPAWFGAALRSEIVPPLVIDGRPIGPRDMWTTSHYGTFASRAMINHGQSARLVALYRQAFRSREEAVASLSANRTIQSAVPVLAMALRANGDAFEADYLLNALDQWLTERFGRRPGNRVLLWQIGRLRAAQGRNPEALDLIARAVAAGWLPEGRTDAVDLAQEPALAGLRSDSRFVAIRAHILQHVARERAEIGDAADRI